ncbi:MAG: hypothetical protein LAO55_03615 [Acidobacteriia bacterium]|nr:hypothetical protein [Terriglobia bacterium]
MKTHHWMVTALLRLYPTAWRREYGPELTGMLLVRPLTAGIVGDVLRSALWQRLRVAEPSTLVGLAMLLVMLNGFVWNIVAPSPYGGEASMLLQNLWGSNLYVLLLVGCGLWTHLRHRGKLDQSGLAAVKISFLAGIPLMLAGILMWLGILGVIVLGPRDTPTTFHEHGFTYTYYDAQIRSCWIRVSEPTIQLQAIQSTTCPPAPLGVMLSPLSRLPASWLWGALGGLLGRWIGRSRRRPLVTSWIPRLLPYWR